jgi:hypothetical protein
MTASSWFSFHRQHIPEVLAARGSCHWPRYATRFTRCGARPLERTLNSSAKSKVRPIVNRGIQRHAAPARPRMHMPGQSWGMAAMKDRTRRPDGAPTVLLQGRVSPRTRAEVQAAAAANGVSISYYLEALLDQLVADQGTLPALNLPGRHQEELPIADVA